MSKLKAGDVVSFNVGVSFNTSYEKLPKYKRYEMGVVEGVSNNSFVVICEDFWEHSENNVSDWSFMSHELNKIGVL